MNSPALVSKIEGSEAEALLSWERNAPGEVRSALGMNDIRFGDTVVLSMRNDPTFFWSKALGFGRSVPVTSEEIAKVCAFYAQQKTPQAVLQLAPSAIPEDWEDICAREGITCGSSWVKLVAKVDDVIERANGPERRQPSGVKVSLVEPAEAHRWASVMMEGFGMPKEHFAEMAAASVLHPDWYPHALWLNGEIVGTGTMHRGSETAQLFGGAVLEPARNRGGQTELLSMRASLARDLGCRLLVAETGAEADGEHNSSLHNMLRLGFRVAYERQNWVWKLAE